MLIDKQFARTHNIPFKPLIVPYQYAMWMDTEQTRSDHPLHLEKFVCFIAPTSTSLGKATVILGLAWLRCTDSQID